MIVYYIEKLMNYYGWYKMPRYYIYKVQDNGHENRCGLPGLPYIYMYYEMLKYTSVLDRLKIKYRIEKIEIQAKGEIYRFH